MADGARRGGAGRGQFVTAYRRVPADRIETLAARAGYETAEMVRKSYGGGQIYIPMDRARRNAEIYREFTGDNHFEPARKYRMTLNSVYKILRSEKARRSVK